MTKYLILRHADDFPSGEAWDIVATAEGSSAKAAIRIALNAKDKASEQSGGEYVAVPARSWQPEKVAVEQALKFS
jgi:hypothetical protein